VASSVTAVAIPADSRVAHVYASTDLADAYAIELPEGASADPEVLARFIFAHQASWVAALMKLRDLIVAGFGLKTSSQLRSAADDRNAPKRVGIFRIYNTSAREIVLGEDDRHLDFRVSVLRSTASTGAQRLVVSTVVNCHNRLGRLYIFFIAPFHRLVVQSSLRSAARRGWPGCR
jgi:Protein of unknown function (DUF2867)